MRWKTPIAHALPIREWRMAFAWRPIEIGSYTHWLEFVDRRERVVYGGETTILGYDFRARRGLLGLRPVRQIKHENLDGSCGTMC